MQRGFSRVKHNEFLNTHLYQLTTKFTTDTTRRTCHQYNFSSKFFGNLTKINIDFSTSQQIFNLNRTNPLMEVTVRVSLTDSRRYQSFKRIAFTIFQKTVLLQTGIFITGKQNAANSPFPHYILNI